MKKRIINEKDLRTFAMHLISIKETYYFEDTIQQDDYFNPCDPDEELVPLIFEPFLELPILFPNEWYTGNFTLPLWVEDGEYETISSVMKFFNLNDYQFLHLFSASEEQQRPEIYGGKRLNNRNCNSQTIGYNILELIEKVRFIEANLIKDINLN